MPIPVVAVVGRPNVGKSTLFNRLVGFKKSVVHDRPGVTRDRLYEEADILGREVLLVDTGGLEASPDTELLVAMRAQTMVAVEEADVILLVVDGPKGITVPDREVADLLRRVSTPVVVAVNKIDGERHEGLMADFWELGLTPMLSISAEHGRGIYELAEAILERLPPADAVPQSEVEPSFPWGDDDPPDDGTLPEGDDEDETPVEETGPVLIAVLGRPNLGKSTLVNRLLGEERHLVMDMPGTTTDPVDSALRSGDRDYVLVDTAGVRRRARIGDPLERFVSLRSIRAIERCHVVLLLLDGTEGPTDQDAKLAELINDRGRALVVLVNKWDLAKDSEDMNSQAIDDRLLDRMPHITWAPHLYISAKTGKGCHRILPMVDEVYAAFNRRISTSKLNKFLISATASYAPPQHRHHPVRLYYMTQTRVRPPTFMAFANSADSVSPAYKRYLTNRLREAFNLDGTSLRLHIRTRRKLGEEGT